jgi:pimeloyl-ACP methyl ester carboxylesterase
VAYWTREDRCGTSRDIWAVEAEEKKSAVRRSPQIRKWCSIRGAPAFCGGYFDNSEVIRSPAERARRILNLTLPGVESGKWKFPRNDVNARTGVKMALVIFAALICDVPEAAAQSGLTRREIVRAGPATLQVTIRGKGEPIVFIPSRERGVQDFDALSNRLAQAGYQVILPEPRAIGGSTGPLKNITYHDLASDVAATIESLVGRPATVIGHDFGNRIARTLASDYPRLVKQLILLSAGGMVPRSPEMEKLTTHFSESALSRGDRLTAIRQIFFAAGNDVPRTWEEGWYFEVARAQRASDARTSQKEWWAGGSAPMLVVQGTEDVVALPENAKRLAAEFPERVTLVEIPHAGHALLPEQPEQVEKAILAYLHSRAGTR